MTSRDNARALAQKHISAGDPLGWFEALYQSASGNAGNIPWADLAPNHNLTDWLDREPPVDGKRALVVGSGLGDDAEELVRRGYEVTAFDISESAITWCKTRFSQSGVSYVAADLLNFMPQWESRFDLIVEIYTLQVLPAELRPIAVRNLEQYLAPDGALLIICRGRNPEDPIGTMPWPLMRSELDLLGERLIQRSFEDFLDGEETPVRRFRAVYSKREKS